MSNQTDMNVRDSSPLNLYPLAKAIHSLRDALAYPKNEFTRDATVRCFEYTFDLSGKILRRYLEAETGIEAFNLKEVFRYAGRQDIVMSVEAWFVYLKRRHLAMITGSGRIAEETYQLAEAFLDDAQALLNELAARCGNRGQ